jgi:hypothetical protein
MFHSERPYEVCCRAASGGLPSKQVVTEDEPHPARGPTTIAKRLAPLRPRRPCPQRAPSSSPQRTPTVNSGHRPNWLSCTMAGCRAARGCFPSSRLLKALEPLPTWGG